MPCELSQNAAAAERCAVAAAAMYRDPSEVEQGVPQLVVTDCRSLLALNSWANAVQPSARWAGLWAPLQKEFNGVAILWTRSRRDDNQALSEEDRRHICGNRHADGHAGEAARKGAINGVALRALAVAYRTARGDLLALGKLLVLWPALDQRGRASRLATPAADEVLFPPGARHRLHAHRSGWKCSTCGTFAITAASPIWTKRPCLLLPEALQGAACGARALGHFLGGVTFRMPDGRIDVLLFCYRCGALASAKCTLLTEACRSRPCSVGTRNRLKRILRGVHPTIDLAVSKPWPLGRSEPPPSAPEDGGGFRALLGTQAACSYWQAAERVLAAPAASPLVASSGD